MSALLGAPPSPAVASGASAFPPVGDVVTPYYDADGITLYLGDCREVTEWLAADVLVTDPPYGKKWGQHGAYHGGSGHRGIAGDGDTSVRDHAISAFSDKPMLVFGAQVVPAPPGAKQSLVWHKSRDAGVFGSIAGWRRDWEQVYVLGTWPKQPAQRSSVIHIGGGLSSYLKGTHPHAKPVPLLAQLIEHCPPGVIADPFAGSGSTLVAARSCGRQAIGVEIEERYCEITATRLAQGDLPLAVGGAS